MRDEFENLPAVERIARYRELAEKAAQMAADAKTKGGQQSFLMICSGWHALADALEKDLRPSGLI